MQADDHAQPGAQPGADATAAAAADAVAALLSTGDAPGDFIPSEHYHPSSPIRLELLLCSDTHTLTQEQLHERLCLLDLLAAVPQDSLLLSLKESLLSSYGLFLFECTLAACEMIPAMCYALRPSTLLRIVVSAVRNASCKLGVDSIHLILSSHLDQVLGELVALLAAMPQGTYEPLRCNASAAVPGTLLRNVRMHFVDTAFFASSSGMDYTLLSSVAMHEHGTFSVATAALWSILLPWWRAFQFVPAHTQPLVMPALVQWLCDPSWTHFESAFPTSFLSQLWRTSYESCVGAPPVSLADPLASRMLEAHGAVAPREVAMPQGLTSVPSDASCLGKRARAGTALAPCCPRGTDAAAAVRVEPRAVNVRRRRRTRRAPALPYRPSRPPTPFPVALTAATDSDATAPSPPPGVPLLLLLLPSPTHTHAPRTHSGARADRWWWRRGLSGRARGAAGRRRCRALATARARGQP